MKCNRCREEYGREEACCPNCGAPNPFVSGVFQTSTVLISSGGSQQVYRSVADVPADLRSRLRQSTNSANSGTIVIADRRGRREIAKAFHGLSEASREGVLRAIAAVESDSDGFTPERKAAVLSTLMVLAFAALAITFATPW